MTVDALRENRNTRALVGTHQGGFLQQLCEVAVGRRVPAHDSLERQAIHLRHLDGAGETLPVRARARAITGGERRPVELQSEQAVHLVPPRIELARGLRIRIDHARGGTDTLQAHRLPHEQHLVVRTGGHDDQIARQCGIDRLLDRTGAARGHWRIVLHDGGGLATDCDSHRVNRLLAVGIEAIRRVQLPPGRC